MAITITWRQDVGDNNVWNLAGRQPLSYDLVTQKCYNINENQEGSSSKINVYDPTSGWSVLTIQGASFPSSSVYTGRFGFTYDEVRNVHVYLAYYFSWGAPPYQMFTWELDTSTSPPTLSYRSTVGNPRSYIGCPIAWTGTDIIFPSPYNTPAGTYNYDGTTWSLATDGDHPANMYVPSMAYHRGTGNVIFFGYNAVADQMETWRYSGGAWSQLSPAVQPPGPRNNHNMAYLKWSATQDYILMYGGTDEESTGRVQYGDMWLFEDSGGGTWHRLWNRYELDHNFRSCKAGMVYDIARERTIIYGGIDHFTG